MPRTPQTKSENPAYPDAPPTAPGGMSKANLRVELAEIHGVPMDETRTTRWPDLIDMVIQERLNREDEEREVPKPATVQTFDNPECSYCDASAVYAGTGPDRDLYCVEHTDQTEDDLLCLLHEMTNCADCSGETRVFEESLSDSTPEAEDMFEDLAADPDDGVVMAPLIEPFEDVVEPGEWSDWSTVGQDSVFDPETLFAEMQTERDEHLSTLPPPLFIGMPGIRDYVFDGHAGAGPSGAERWINCTMSLTLSREFLETLSPNQQRTFAESGTAARQGTTAHAVGEARANHALGNIDDAELDNALLDLALEPVEGEEYTDEMDEYVAEYVALVESLANEKGANNIQIESRVEAAIPLTDLHEGEIYVVHGSADCTGLPTEDDKELVVGDLKYGEGIFVDVEENPQVRIYALGVLDSLTDEDGNLTVDVEKVTYYIAQPRLGGLRSWSESLDDLLDWRDEVLAPALTKALYGANEGATFNPGDVQCQFCPGRGTCPALIEQRMEQASELFDVIVEAEFENGPGAFPEASTLSDTMLGKFLQQVSGLVKIHTDLREEAERRLHRGTSVPGYQLVNYTPPRKWRDGALDALSKIPKGLSAAERDALYKDPALVTPTQAEKILGPEVYANIVSLIDKPPIRPVIAKEGDRRKPWTGTPPEQMFSALPEEGE